MKKFKLFGIVILFLSAVVVSCEDDGDGLDVQDHGNNNFALIMDTMLMEMMAMQMTGDADYDFAKMMMMHHDGAIQLSQELLNRGGADTIRKMAQEIITKQQAEKADLMEFTASHTPVATPEGALFAKESMVNNQKLNKHGSDPMIIEMAKMTVEDQNKEILVLQDWLLNNKPYK